MAVDKSIMLLIYFLKKMNWTDCDWARFKNDIHTVVGILEFKVYKVYEYNHLDEFLLQNFND